MEESITELFQDYEEAHQQSQDTISTQKQVTQLWALSLNQDLPWSSVWQSGPSMGRHHCMEEQELREQTIAAAFHGTQGEKRKLPAPGESSSKMSSGGNYYTPGDTDTTDHSNCRCLQTGNSRRGQDTQSIGVCSEVERNHVSKYDKFKIFNNHLLCTYREGIVTCASFNPDYNNLWTEKLKWRKLKSLRS